MVELIFIDGPIETESLGLPPLPHQNVVGATAQFKGTVRADIIDGKKVKAIEFSTQKEVAYQIAIEILKANREKYCLVSACIYHSIGIIKAGEACFFVQVESSHRKEAFSALPDIVDEFKEKVPLFGKEILEDDTHVWKQNTTK